MWYFEFLDRVKFLMAALLEEDQLENNFSHIDFDGFYKEIQEIKKEIEANLGEKDIHHLKKMENIGRISTIIGVLSAGIAPNPVSAIALSLGRSTRWMMMHHIGHRGYDKVPNIPEKYTSKSFASGLRRFVDWSDWMTPEAWKYEHNVLHHSHTGEDNDPDVIERNTERLRDLPKSLRYALMGILALTWRASYYAPATTQTWKNRFSKEKQNHAKTDFKLIFPDLVLKSYLPYVVHHFGVFPLLFSPFGLWSVFSALSNSIMADLLTNLHTFIVVGPNHSGDDLYRSDSKPQSKAERYFRQVVGTVNYDTGNDLNDFAHLWLNYQIEHHLYPDIPMLKYQEYQPRIKAICEKYNVTYVQENVFVRVKKMMDVAVGNTSMKRRF